MEREFLTDEEESTGEPLNEYYGRVGNRICAGRRWVEIADADSFALLGGHYAIDRDRVYFADGSYWRTVNSPMHWDVRVDCVVDRESFEVLGYAFARDRNRVYWREDVLVGVDAETFKPISKHYARSGSEVLYLYSGIHKSLVTDDGHYCGMVPIRLEGADANSFECLGGLYGRDATTLFHHSAVVTRRAASSAELLNEEMVRTSESVFFQGTVVERADPATFELVDDSRFCRDANRVYFAAYGADDEWLSIIEGADPASLNFSNRVTPATPRTSTAFASAMTTAGSMSQLTRRTRPKATNQARADRGRCAATCSVFDTRIVGRLDRPFVAIEAAFKAAVRILGVGLCGRGRENRCA